MRTEIKTIVMLTSLALPIAFSSCSSNNSNGLDDNDTEENAVYSPLKISAKQASSLEAQQNIALDIFGSICDDSKDNVVISPLSVTMATSVLANATDESSSLKIAKAFGFESLSELNEYNKYIIDNMPLVDPANVKLSLANASWINKLLVSDIDNAFQQTLINSYSGVAKLRDFSNSTSVASEMNKWASDNTNNLINHVVDNFEITPLYSMYILNAIYFKGLWKYPFDKDITVSADFYDNSDAVVGSASMMRSQNVTEYTDNDYITAIKLPYGNDNSFNMIILLPKDGVSYKNAMQSAMSSEYTETDVFYEIPKFEISEKIYLSEFLDKVGIPTSVYINMAHESESVETKHFAKITVDESGSEAAAVTVIGVVGSADNTSVQPIKFTANHPFAFIIEEASSHVVLFFGKVVKP
jgi:serpin B